MEKSVSSIPRRQLTEGPKAGSIFRIFIIALSALKRPVVALPSIIYLGVQIGIMVLYLNSTSSFLNTLWAFFVSGISAEILSHYPHHIILMQPVLSRLDILFDIFIHVIFLGALVLLVTSALSGSRLSPGKSFTLSIKRYPRLVVVSLISSSTIFFCINISRLASKSFGYVPHAAVLIAGVLSGLVLQAFFLYSLPLILLKGLRSLEAIRSSFSIAARHFPVTFLAVLLPFILTLPTVFLDIKAEMISLRLSPDFMIYNHVVGEILQAISTYLLIAGSTVILIRYIFETPKAARPIKGRKSS